MLNNTIECAAIAATGYGETARQLSDDAVLLVWKASKRPVIGTEMTKKSARSAMIC